MVARLLEKLARPRDLIFDGFYPIVLTLELLHGILALHVQYTDLAARHAAKKHSIVHSTPSAHHLPIHNNIYVSSALDTHVENRAEQTIGDEASFALAPGCGRGSADSMLRPGNLRHTTSRSSQRQSQQGTSLTECRLQSTTQSYRTFSELGASPILNNAVPIILDGFARNYGCLLDPPVPTLDCKARRAWRRLPAAPFLDHGSHRLDKLHSHSRDIDLWNTTSSAICSITRRSSARSPVSLRRSVACTSLRRPSPRLLNVDDATSRDLLVKGELGVGILCEQLFGNEVSLVLRMTNSELGRGRHGGDWRNVARISKNSRHD
ncbi:hypothetical protein FB45DRAFT_1096989 [Roridomyces roridus]|uniref:Uncharacterized protein n=1 Tax=Roridomyces roridus TaxID=1738132 RepID=A0AAD7BEG9_9AGAR|nr:hypothetical protein FB45DRAFT_1096989 [Roridomyces roridus]